MGLIYPSDIKNYNNSILESTFISLRKAYSEDKAPKGKWTDLQSFLDYYEEGFRNGLHSTAWCVYKVFCERVKNVKT